VIFSIDEIINPKLKTVRTHARRERRAKREARKKERQR
jgi:hypothetical protein